MDEAGIIPAQVRTDLDSKLADMESRSGIQLVIATVGSLQGGDIETYANQLFRRWQLGEKQKNNGVLLLVAPAERQVRIEVGYGLEGTLTDALSKIIITNAITPRFQAGDFGGGVTRGVEDIITVLTTDASEWGKRPDLRLKSGSDDAIPVPVGALILAFLVLMIVSRNFRRLVFALLVALSDSRAHTGGRGGSWGGGSSGGSWGGGGFSGGGGSSGGGGASGRW